MAKLSTAALKDMIEGWLSTPKVRENLMGYYNDRDPDEEQDQVGDEGWKLWCDGSKWKRCEKRRLGEDAEDQFGTIEYLGEWKPGLPGSQQERRQVPYFDTDEAGEANMELVTRYFNDPKVGARCILRVFSAPGDFANNYRLEVTTTPDDDAVVGWSLIVD